MFYGLLASAWPTHRRYALNVFVVGEDHERNLTQHQLHNCEYSRVDTV